MNRLKQRTREIDEIFEALKSPPPFDRVVGDKRKLAGAVINTWVYGYGFQSKALHPFARKAIEVEARRLSFREGDYVAKPIQEYKKTRVTQKHERAYFPVGDRNIPIASWVSHALAHHIRWQDPSPPWERELATWEPTEVGYQRYRDHSDHISPHRDRRTDELLGATLTISGSAVVKIHKPLDDPDDYSNLELVDEFETKPGSLMLLRAPGFGNGGQVIHEVLPPKKGSRLILNLRMRPDVLKQPSEEMNHE